MGNRRKHLDFYGITSLKDVFNNSDRTGFAETRDSGDEAIALARARGWLDTYNDNIPKRCTEKTKIDITRALHKAYRLVEQAKKERLINVMLAADNSKDYFYDCGTEALSSLFEGFRRKVGGQDVEFRRYVEAATQASLKKVWNENDEVALVSLTGNTKSRITYLLDYAHRLGFVCDAGTDSDGNTAIVLLDVKLKSRLNRKVTRKTAN